MILKSLAKINLFLNINGKRTNSPYHELESLAVFTEDIYDEIDINISDKNSLFIEKSEFSEKISSTDNIILKALNSLNILKKYKINLTKNIPIAAGLGGGSSDAAMILNHLIKKENLPLSNDQINQIALSLGSDVAICLKQKAGYILSIGEKTDEVKKIPDIWAVLVNPKIIISTKAIFEMNSFNFRPKIKERPNNFANLFELLDFIKIHDNELEKNAKKLCPEIANIINTLSQTSNCLLARMSGSGATCFGLYKTKQDSMNASEEIKKIYPQYWIKSSKII